MFHLYITYEGKYNGKAFKSKSDITAARANGNLYQTATQCTYISIR